MNLLGEQVKTKRRFKHYNNSNGFSPLSLNVTKMLGEGATLPSYTSTTLRGAFRSKVKHS